MQVEIKTFDVKMMVKSNGIEFEVKSADGQTHHGDCYLTMSGLIWCQGRTSRQNGIPVTWQQFIDWMDSRRA